MSRKHFERAAHIVRMLPTRDRIAATNAFVALFASEPRFDVARFRGACGLGL